MMVDAIEYRFHIDAFTPDTLPMARLAEYMADLAKLLGQPTSVHFVRLEAGSVELISKIEREAAPKVRDTVRRVRRGDAPPESLRAYKNINRRLKEDNGVGTLREESADIIQFPGRNAIEDITFGAFNQEGSIDGRLIRLGGTAGIVPVHLEYEDQRIHHAEARRAIARKMGAFLFRELRVFGEGRWLRDREGAWILERFTIQNFEPLDEAPLSTVVANLRKTPGNEWAAAEDAWGDIQRLRHDQDGEAD